MFQLFFLQCCFWSSKERGCEELPKWSKHDDKLGFGQNSDFKGRIILSTDLNEREKQSFVFAFAQETSEIAIGYFYYGIHGAKNTQTRVQSIKWFWQESKMKQIPKANSSIVPTTDPCIIIEGYTVFIIGGKSGSGYVPGTWMKTFEIYPNQVFEK